MNIFNKKTTFSYFTTRTISMQSQESFYRELLLLWRVQIPILNHFEQAIKFTYILKVDFLKLFNYFKIINFMWHSIFLKVPSAVIGYDEEAIKKDFD